VPPGKYTCNETGRPPGGQPPRSLARWAAAPFARSIPGAGAQKCSRRCAASRTALSGAAPRGVATASPSTLAASPTRRHIVRALSVIVLICPVSRSRAACAAGLRAPVGRARPVAPPHAGAALPCQVPRSRTCCAPSPSPRLLCDTRQCVTTEVIIPVTHH